MLARSVRRRSMRWPCGLGVSRRVLTSSSDSTSRLMASLAAAISAAVICAKSFFCSTSRSDTVSRASISSSGGFLSFSPCPARAPPARAARRAWASPPRVGGACGSIAASSLSIAALRRKNRWNAWSNKQRMLVALHEHRVQRPVEILARADAGGLHRRERIEHRARPDRNAGRPQRTREIDDVLGELALHKLSSLTGDMDYSAARSSERTWSSSSLAFEPSMRAMSS